MQKFDLVIALTWWTVLAIAGSLAAGLTFALLKALPMLEQAFCPTAIDLLAIGTLLFLRPVRCHHPKKVRVRV